MFIGRKEYLDDLESLWRKRTSSIVACKGRNGKGIGCQIDLLVQTPRAAYVVEIKRRNEIGAEIEKEVAERMKRLPLRRGMSKRPVLVCDGHVDPAVEADGFFSAIIQGRRLLGI